MCMMCAMTKQMPTPWTDQTNSAGWMRLPNIVIRHAAEIIDPTPVELLTLIAIASTTGSGPAAFTEGELAQMTASSTRTMGRALARLEASGLIEVHPGAGRAHRYTALGFVAVMNDVTENLAAGRRADDDLGLDLLAEVGSKRRKARLEGHAVVRS